MTQSKQRIDWDSIKRKVRAAQVSLEESSEVDEARLRQLFRQRAERLATRGSRDQSKSETTAVLTFKMSNETYGIPLRDIAQVFPNKDVTRVPGSAAELVGVANLQGDVRSVLDLGRLLGLPDPDDETSQFILLLRRDGFQVGLRVGQIDQVRQVFLDMVTSAHDDPADPSARFVQGLTRDHLILLRTEAFFDSFALKET